MNSHNPREAGISLVESAIAFLVIAILVAIALPSVSSSMAAYNLRSAADHAAERLAAGRALAMEKNKNVSVAFRKAGQYGFDFNADGVVDTQDPDYPSTTLYSVELLPSGISFTDATFPPGADFVVFTFNARGELPIGTVIPVGAPGIGVTLQNQSSRTKSVLVNLRGKVWVQ